MRDVLVVSAELFSPNVRHSHRQVYGVLLRFANKHTGVCWPSQELVARLLNCHRTHVQRVIKEMVLLGYLVVERIGRRCRYTLKKFFVLANSEPIRESRSPEEESSSISKTESSAAREPIKKTDQGSSGDSHQELRDLKKFQVLQLWAEFIATCRHDLRERWDAFRFSDSAEARAFREGIDKLMRASTWFKDRHARIRCALKRRGIDVPPLEEKMRQEIRHEPLPPDETQQAIVYINGHFPPAEAEAMLMELMEHPGTVLARIAELRRLRP